MKVSSSTNFPISDTLATRFSFSSVERDGFSENIQLGQELDDANSISLRSDWIMELSDTSSLRFFAQYFDSDRNGAPFLSESKYCAKNLSEDVSLNSIIQSLLKLMLFASSNSWPSWIFSLNPSLSTEEKENLVARVSDIGKLVEELTFIRPNES